MDINLQGKQALVCGASKGIGEAVAKELAALGANVTLMARNKEKLVQIKNKLSTNIGQKHQVIAADFSDPQATIDSLLKQGNNFHVLVNNTGGPAGGSILEAEVDAFEKAFTMHVKMSHLLVQNLAPFMKSEQYGRIINVVSTSVKIPIPGLGVSNTIRGAIASWSKTMANELAEDGITVNNILPGFTETDRLSEIITNNAEKRDIEKAKVRKMMIESIPAKRFGLPEEVGALAGFLASPSAGYITGTSIPIDGGRTGSL